MISLVTPPPPRGYFLGKFIPRERKFPRKIIHHPGGKFSGWGENCLGNSPPPPPPPWVYHALSGLPGGTTLVLSANQVACHKIHLVARQKSAVGSWEVGYVMFWLIFLEGTSLGWNVFGQSGPLSPWNFLLLIISFIFFFCCQKLRGGGQAPWFFNKGGGGAVPPRPPPPPPLDPPLVCMYVYMYVCMYVCMHACLYLQSNRYWETTQIPKYSLLRQVVS